LSIVAYQNNILLTSISSDYLFLENIKLLYQANAEDGVSESKKCIDNDGFWNMASVCTDSGFHEVKCTVKGKISAFGVTFDLDYARPGKTYTIPWARYSCQTSTGNCCKKQGLYSGETKLA
jgi:hypothetical protein